LSRGAEYKDIMRSYKHLSMRYHPLKNHSNVATNSMKFAEVCEAFDVLYNPETRAIYDEYGEYGLKEGIVRPDGSKIGGGYFLRTSPENYFEKIFQDGDFLTESRENDGSDAISSLFNDGLGGLNKAKPGKPADVEVSIDVTLEELYNGAVKSVMFQIDEIRHDAKTTAKKNVTK